MKRQIIRLTAATLATFGCISSVDFKPVQARPVGFGNVIVKGATTDYEERPDALIGFMVLFGLNVFVIIGNAIVNKK